MTMTPDDPHGLDSLTEQVRAVPPEAQIPETHLVVDVSTLLDAADTFAPIAPDTPEGFAACVDRLLVAARLVGSVDVGAMVALVDDAGDLVKPEGWRGPFTHRAVADLVRSAERFVDYVGLEDLVAFVDEDFPGERTAGVAAAAAGLLAIGKGSDPLRPSPRPEGFGTPADGGVWVPDLDTPGPSGPSAAGEVDRPRRPPPMPKAVDVGTFDDRPDVPGTPID